jgi:hypothetical protein
MSGNYNEEDVYAVVFSDFKQINKSNLSAIIITKSNASRPESLFQATNPRDPPEVHKQRLNMSVVERLLYILSLDNTAASQNLRIVRSTEALLNGLTPKKAGHHVVLFKKFRPQNRFL